MSKQERNNYCKLSTYYDKAFKGKVTTLKLCDKFMKSRDYIVKKDNVIRCPFCGNNLV